MPRRIPLAFLVGSLFGLTSAGNDKKDMSLTLFDFTSSNARVDGWIEQSDSVRTVGMSKATIAIQKTQVFSRAVFFALLNPQPNGAGFAGVRHLGQPKDLSNYDGLEMKCRGQGEFTDFKVVLRHRGLNDEPNVSYEQTFPAPKEDFAVVRLPFQQFQPYYRGRKIDDAEPLDASNVTGFGIQFHGGVYLPVKQKGPSTLELDWIRAYKGTNEA